MNKKNIRLPIISSLHNQSHRDRHLRTERKFRDSGIKPTDFPESASRQTGVFFTVPIIIIYTNSNNHNFFNTVLFLIPFYFFVVVKIFL